MRLLRNYSSILTKISLLLLILFSFYILFYNLGKPTLDNWDEAWYAQMAKEMLQMKEFVILQWNYVPHFDKPPLYVWILSLSSSILGLSEFSIRLPSAISALLIISTVLLYSYKQWGFVPSLVAFSTLAFNHLFIWRARSGNIDVFVTLLIFISFFLILSKKRWRYIALGILFACIYLTKLTLVFFPLLIFVFHELLYQRREIAKNKYEYMKLFGEFFLITGIWFMLGHAKEGKEFVEYYLFKSDQGLFALSSFRFQSKYILHAYYALQRRFFYVFLLGIFFLAKSIKRPQNFLLLLFSGTLLVLLSFSTKDNNWYLLPSMPFWSLAAAYGVYRLFRIFHNSIFISLPLTIVILLLSYRTYTVNITAIMNTSSTKQQVESAKVVKGLSKKEDIVVRLDHLYPATLFYADRKVLASPIESDTKQNWISRKDLTEAVRKKKIKWLVGTTGEVAFFINENKSLPLETIKVNQTELIIKVL